ncbi:MAG: amidohydrolase family protein [Chloroflexi bacterium]|nr:amidohydrolase family protein [Chloroflexota bacterium]
MIIDGHHHIWYDIQEKEKLRRYFPTRQAWDQCVTWAYGGTPPFKDPNALYSRHLARMSDYDGKYTAESLEYHKIDATTVFPVDYDLAWGQPADITIEEKLIHTGELERKHPGKFLPYVNVDPRRTGALDIVKKAFEEWGKFYALKLIPGSGFYPWDPIVYPIYEYCIDRGIPIAFCVEGGGRGYRMERFNDPSNINDLMCEFRDMRVIILHAGVPYTSWFEKCCYNAQHVNCSIEIDAWMYGRVRQGTGAAAARGRRAGHPNMIDDPDGLTTMFHFAKVTAGAHKIIWGTDTAHGPSYTKETDMEHLGWSTPVKWLRSLPERGAKLGYRFTAEEVDWMVGGNLARVLGIQKDPAWNIPDKFGWRYRFPSANRYRS